MAGSRRKWEATHGVKQLDLEMMVLMTISLDELLL